jgi:anthranilate/para-aminobenzoate synthase component I
MTATPFILLDDSLSPAGTGGPGHSLLFAAPERVITAYEPGDVGAALDAITQGLGQGLHAAGLLAYELGYCLEPKLEPLMPQDRRHPLIWMGLFREPRRFDEAATRAWLDANGALERSTISGLQLSWTRDQYTAAFAKVQDYIAAGDVYQINLTLKYLFAFAGDPVALYAALRRKKRFEFGALIGAPD